MKFFEKREVIRTSSDLGKALKKALEVDPFSDEGFLEEIETAPYFVAIWVGRFARKGNPLIVSLASEMNLSKTAGFLLEFDCGASGDSSGAKLKPEPFEVINGEIQIN